MPGASPEHKDEIAGHSEKRRTSSEKRYRPVSQLLRAKWLEQVVLDARHFHAMLPPSTVSYYTVSWINAFAASDGGRVLFRLRRRPPAALSQLPPTPPMPWAAPWLALSDLQGAASATGSAPLSAEDRELLTPWLVVLVFTAFLIGFSRRADDLFEDMALEAYYSDEDCYTTRRTAVHGHSREVRPGSPPLSDRFRLLRTARRRIGRTTPKRCTTESDMVLWLYGRRSALAAHPPTPFLRRSSRCVHHLLPAALRTQRVDRVNGSLTAEADDGQESPEEDVPSRARARRGAHRRSTGIRSRRRRRSLSTHAVLNISRRHQHETTSKALDGPSDGNDDM
ncbi:uncharacterized protein LOC144178747 [Haemaphysalis longicornis]